MPEVVSADKVGDIGVFETEVLDKEADGIGSDFLVDEHKLFGEVVYPEVLLCFFGEFLVVVG